ncbi:hypothetical protein CTA2_7410 [Colletotrichum tanaceti]|nr:hypothetical protein CTA2_7410 [Colletotrichum tanaceti]
MTPTTDASRPSNKEAHSHQPPRVSVALSQGPPLQPRRIAPPTASLEDHKRRITVVTRGVLALAASAAPHTRVQPTSHRPRQVRQSKDTPSETFVAPNHLSFRPCVSQTSKKATGPSLVVTRSPVLRKKKKGKRGAGDHCDPYYRHYTKPNRQVHHLTMSLPYKLKREAMRCPTTEMPLPLMPFVFLAHFAQTVTDVLTTEARRTTTNLSKNIDALRLQVRGPEHSFAPFSRLPPELRLKIWNHALPPRTLLASHAPNPSLLSVNREARHEALLRYTLVRLNTWGDRRIYIDFQRDSIAIVEGKGGGGFPVRGARHVIVVCEEPFHNPGSYLKCRYRAGLDSLTLIIGASLSCPTPLPIIQELQTPEDVQQSLGYSKEESERIGMEVRDLAQGWGNTQIHVGKFV